MTTRAGNNHQIFGSAIVVFNHRLRFAARTDLATDNITVATLSLGQKSLNLVSAYFKFRIPTEEHLQSLGAVLDSLTGTTVVCADFNAASERWFARHTDPRGRRVLGFFDDRSFHLANVRSPNYTFHGPRGSSNVDITMAQDPGAISNWTVVAGKTDSDYSIIHFAYHTGAITMATDKPNRFNVAKADWDRFSSNLISSTATVEEDWDRADTHTRAALLTRSILIAAEDSIPRSGNGRKPKPSWWSEELQRLRRLLNADSRRRYLPNGGYTPEYLNTRTAYKKQLRRDKLTSWRAFYTGKSTTV